MRVNSPIWLVVVACGWIIGCNMTNQGTLISQDKAKVVENAVRELREGTPRIAVERLLDAHQVGHTWVGDTRRMHAILRNVDTGRDTVVTKNISFVLQFDLQERLLQTKVETLYTGP
jgi:hypothetical protein